MIVKLARGHVAHQYSEPQLDDPTHVAVMPLPLMSDEQREAFETVPETHFWPEIGSRAFVNLIVGWRREIRPRERLEHRSGGSISVSGDPVGRDHRPHRAERVPGRRSGLVRANGSDCTPTMSDQPVRSNLSMKSVSSRSPSTFG